MVGTFYDNSGNLMSVSGKLLAKATPATNRYMRGEVNPKTGVAFTVAEQRKIVSVSLHNLLQNLAARRNTIRGVSLLDNRDTVASCQVEELEKMVTTRGGNVTGRDGKALRREKLQRIVWEYLAMEAKNSRSIVYYNRSKHNNGIFANTDTTER